MATTAETHPALEAVRTKPAADPFTREDLLEHRDFLRQTCAELIRTRSALRTELESTRKQLQLSRKQRRHLQRTLDAVVAAVVARGGDQAATDLLRDVAQLDLGRPVAS